MRQDLVARHSVVGTTLGPGKSRARGGERLEPQTLQVQRTPYVPRIGNGEAAGLMHLVEGTPLVGDGGTGVVHGIDHLTNITDGHCESCRV